MSEANKLPLEMEPVAHDNDTSWLFTPDHQTFIAPKSSLWEEYTSLISCSLFVSLSDTIGSWSETFSCRGCPFSQAFADCSVIITIFGCFYFYSCEVRSHWSCSTSWKRWARCLVEGDVVLNGVYHGLTRVGLSTICLCPSTKLISSACYSPRMGWHSIPGFLKMSLWGSLESSLLHTLLMGINNTDYFYKTDKQIQTDYLYSTQRFKLFKLLVRIVRLPRLGWFWKELLLVAHNSSFHNYSHADDHTRLTTDTSEFKPFTKFKLCLLSSLCRSGLCCEIHWRQSLVQSSGYR